jgi:hypothetical protein
VELANEVQAAAVAVGDGHLVAIGHLVVEAVVEGEAEGDLKGVAGIPEDAAERGDTR